MFPVYVKSQISELLAYSSELKLLKKNSISSNDERPVDVSYTIYDTLAPPLVIMHGLLGTKGNWKSKSMAYHNNTSPPRQVIAIDARNHGDSPHTDVHTYSHIAADMKKLFDRLSIKKAALLGHSMGGRACMLFSFRYPELVERMIVADISPFAGIHMAEFEKIFDILMSVKMPSNVTLSKALVQVDEYLKPKIPNTMLRSFLVANIVEKKVGSFDWRVNMPVLKRDLEHMANFPLESTMKFEGPTLFIAGSKSNFVIKEDFPRILQYFPKAELTYIDGASHWLHRDKPQEFADITLEFLNRQNKVKKPR